MFRKVMYLSIFYCFCFIKDISTDMSEDKVSEKRDPELKEEEDIRLGAIREEKWRYVADKGNDKKKIRALRW